MNGMTLRIISILRKILFDTERLNYLKLLMLTSYCQIIHSKRKCITPNFGLPSLSPKWEKQGRMSVYLKCQTSSRIKLSANILPPRNHGRHMVVDKIWCLIELDNTCTIETAIYWMPGTGRHNREDNTLLCDKAVHSIMITQA